MPDGWFDDAEMVLGDMLAYDLTDALSAASRCFVFWDAHGFEIAEYVLGHLLPRLVDKPHVVVMHDMGDRYNLGETHRDYGGRRLWNGVNGGASYLWLGDSVSNVAQAISVVDFATRNRLPLRSPDESFRVELTAADDEHMRHVIGDEFCSARGNWMWFTLNDATADVPLTFPAFVPPVIAPEKTRDKKMPALSGRAAAILSLIAAGGFALVSTGLAYVLGFGSRPP